MKFDLTYVNCNYNSFLKEGIILLDKQKTESLKALYFNQVIAGVYFIYNKTNRYIGESSNLAKRLETHSKGGNGSFIKKCKSSEIIDSFIVKKMKISIGRAELEEYGIGYLDCNLNTTSKKLSHRFNYSIKSTKSWHSIQNAKNDILKSAKTELFKKDKVLFYESSPINESGIYRLINEIGECVYIGESIDLKTRHNNHGSNRSESSSLRRNIGRDVFKFVMKPKKGKKGQLLKKKGFTVSEEEIISSYISKLKYQWVAVRFGREEIEEFLINGETPRFNRSKK